MYFQKRGTTWTMANEGDVQVMQELPYGVYSVEYNANSGIYYLNELENFKVPEKRYGRTDVHTRHILKAFADDGTFGVLLTGTKGSGKTLLAKNLAVASKLPTLVVTSPFTDNEFFRVLQNIPQPCVVLFDEFEKVYDKDKQGEILTLFDGAFPLEKKLMVLTCNDKYGIGDYFHNRPGRVRYSIKFKGVPPAFIEEYCTDHLKDKSLVDEIKTVAVECEEFNFDMLQALVKELNDFGLSMTETLELLNIKKDPYRRKANYEFTVVGRSEKFKGVIWSIKTYNLDQDDVLNFNDSPYLVVVGAPRKPKAAKPDDFVTRELRFSLYLEHAEEMATDPITGDVVFHFTDPDLDVTARRKVEGPNHWAF